MALDDKIKQAQAELLAQQMLAIGNQPTSAPSPRMARAAQLAAQREAAASTESASMLRNLFSGATQIPGSVYEYGRGIAQSERPLAAFGEDVSALAGGLYEGFKQDPVGFTLDMAPIVGEIRSAMESRELSNMANEAAAAGDTALADRYRQLAAMAAAGAVPFGGIGARGAKRSAMSNIVDVPPGDARAMLNELPLQTGASELPTTPAVAAPAVRMTEGDEAMAAATTQEPLSQQPTGILATSAFADRIANLPEPADIGGYRGVTVSQTPRMQNNPVGELFNREIVSDVEGAMSAYARIPATKNGKVIDTDLFRELSPEYRENRALASNVHEPASELNRAYFTRLLERTRGQEGTWLFTGGGPASGKSAAVSDEVESSAQAVVDGTMGKPDRVVRDVNRVLEDPTKDVSIVYIDRDPVKAFDLALKRSMSMEQNTGSGRTIPVKDFLDMHAASRRSIQKIYEQLGDNPRVDIQIWDNNGNAGEQFLTTVDKISTFDYDTTAERVMTRLENAYDSGEISESVYRGYKTGADPRRSGSGGASEGASGADASSDRPLNEESGQGAAQGNTVKPRGSLEDALTQLDITPQRMEEWRSSREGMRQEKVPQVQQAAEALREGKISTEEYQRTVQQYQPIKPLAAVQKMPTVEEIAMALGKNAEKSPGIVGVNVDIPDGTRVASRLDIPAYEKYDTWVVSLHDGNKTGGNAIGYGQAAVINDVDFMSSAKAALNIATGKSAKGTIARMYGSWENRDPQAVAQQARDILSGKAPDAADWAEVGMNPFRHSYFYRKSDGMPVASAEQVIQVGPLVLAKKPVTRPVESPEHEVNTPEGPRYFKKGGNVERVTNDNRKYF